MRTLLLAAAAVLGLVVAGAAAAKPDPGAAATEAVLVGFDGKADKAIVAKHGAKLERDFSEIGALAVSIPADQVDGLKKEKGVSYVEPDELRYPLGLSDAELTPSLGNGLYGLVTTQALDVQNAGRSGAGIRACVADTGLAYEHPDIAGRYKGGVDYAANPDDTNPTWAGDVHETHGTHVAGIVLGNRGNGQGIFGAAPAADLYYARVMAYNPVTGKVSGSSSDIMSGVKWLVTQAGCKVVNLSLGGGRPSKTEERFYRDMDNRGALIVAASGNDSATSVSYPAAYSTVLSVGAVDVNGAHASFSNTGTGLDISAPGVLVLSSVPSGTGSESSVAAGGSTYRAFGMEYAGRTSGLSGQLVPSGQGQVDEFPASVRGNIALIQRGTISFADKVTNAQNAGAIAAIVYNNAPGDFTGTLGTTGSWIPAVSVSDSTGAALLSAGGSASVVNAASAWDHYDGTSMATPYVAGIAALVWSVNPALTDEAVEDALKASAKDLGPAGYDTTFGYGLANAKAAVARVGG